VVYRIKGGKGLHYDRKAWVSSFLFLHIANTLTLFGFSTFYGLVPELDEKHCLYSELANNGFDVISLASRSFCIGDGG
jgi:hypothetical protein